MIFHSFQTAPSRGPGARWGLPSSSSQTVSRMLENPAQAGGGWMNARPPLPTDAARSSSGTPPPPLTGRPTGFVHRCNEFGEPRLFRESTHVRLGCWDLNGTRTYSLVRPGGFTKRSDLARSRSPSCFSYLSGHGCRGPGRGTVLLSEWLDSRLGEIREEPRGEAGGGEGGDWEDRACQHPTVRGRGAGVGSAVGKQKKIAKDQWEVMPAPIRAISRAVPREMQKALIS